VILNYSPVGRVNVRFGMLRRDADWHHPICTTGDGPNAHCSTGASLERSIEELMMVQVSTM